MKAILTLVPRSEIRKVDRAASDYPDPALCLDKLFFISTKVNRINVNTIPSRPRLWRDDTSTAPATALLIDFPLWWSPRGQGRNPVGHEVGQVLAIACGLVSVSCGQDFHPVDADVVTFGILRQVKKANAFHGLRRRLPSLPRPGRGHPHRTG